MPHKRGQRESTRIRTERDRERLLVAAEAQLREGELDQFTIDKVIERSGISVGAFYRMFVGKQDLLRAVEDRLYGRMREAIAIDLEAGKHAATTLAEAVDHAFGVMIHHTLEERRMCRAIMMLSALDPDMLQKFRENNAAYRDALVAVLARHKSEIVHPDPEWAIHQAYHMYLTTMHGRLVFFGPGMRPVHGVSDEVLFAQLLLSIRSFLLGNGECQQPETGVPAAAV